MKKLILMGRSESGKTTLKQALSREKIQYYKTQYIHYDDILIDTPGEYAQTRHLGYALALYAYEADVVGRHRHRDEDKRPKSQQAAGGILAAQFGLQGDFLCGFRDRGGRGRDSGIFELPQGKESVSGFSCKFCMKTPRGGTE